MCIRYDLTLVCAVPARVSSRRTTSSMWMSLWNASYSVHVWHASSDKACILPNHKTGLVSLKGQYVGEKRH